jgi:Transposase, Mutator family
VRDRADVGAEEKIRFTSSILPKWARRTKSLDALLPILYLRGVSTGDFQEALSALLGKEAPNLSPAVITRLTAEWQADYEAWLIRKVASVLFSTRPAHRRSHGSRSTRARKRADASFGTLKDIGLGRDQIARELYYARWNSHPRGFLRLVRPRNQKRGISMRLLRFAITAGVCVAPLLRVGSRWPLRPAVRKNRRRFKSSRLH